MNKRISASFTFDMVIENCKGSLSMFLADDQKIQKRNAQIFMLTLWKQYYISAKINPEGICISLVMQLVT